VKRQGSRCLVYIDESGFDNRVSQPWGWAQRGTKLFADRTGKREKRENLLMARCKDALLAPMVVEGSVDAGCFEKWLSEWVLPTLQVPSVLILDNAPIHRKNVIRDIAHQCAHQVLFLPKYSPDFNKIEHDFAALKKRRQYATPDTAIDDIIRDYANRNL